LNKRFDTTLFLVSLKNRVFYSRLALDHAHMRRIMVYFFIQYNLFKMKNKRNRLNIVFVLIFDRKTLNTIIVVISNIEISIAIEAQCDRPVKLICFFLFLICTSQNSAILFFFTRTHHSLIVLIYYIESIKSIDEQSLRKAQLCPCKHQTQNIRVQPRFCCKSRPDAGKTDFYCV
jgi:hypothetical protein